jgi:3-deoxy-D-manno-octulosonic-acid transferase
LYIFLLLLGLPFWVKVLFKKEYRGILKYRLFPTIPRSERKRIWIHAVSVGEVRSLKHLIDQLKKSYKNTEIVLTVTTPAGYNCTAELYTDIRVINAPVDFSFTIRRFIKQINPRILILNELEIWPNWVTGVQRHDIPILLINGRMSERAFRRYKKFILPLRPFFNKIDCFLVQAEIYKKRFEQLGIPGEKITVCGNIKADEAFNSLEHLPADREIWEYLGLKPGAEIIVTLASSHKADEELLAPVIETVGDDFLFIIAPRHLTRTEEIECLLEKHGVKFSTWSKRAPGGDKKTGPGRVLIFDRMGYLFNVLKITDIVFMGGTLDPKTGGHNLYEPAAMGKCIVGGPHYNNFPDIGAELQKQGVYHVAADPGTLSAWLQNWRFLDGDAIRQKAVEAVSARRGSVQCILEEIQRFMAAR